MSDSIRHAIAHAIRHAIAEGIAHAMSDCMALKSATPFVPLFLSPSVPLSPPIYGCHPSFGPYVRTVTSSDYAGGWG